MKQFILLLLFPLVVSCSAQSEYEKVIADYLQIENGVKTDLKIEFLEMNVSDITVSDSIQILNNEYQAEKEKRISDAQKSVEHWQNSIEEQKGKKNQLVAKAVIGNAEKRLADAENKLKEAQEWRPDLNRYESRDPSDILAKKAESHFSFMNPKLQTRQEMNALFILSADGKQCYNMIKQ
ncbi:hypothetical protein M2132_002238 [Dysgonomonas sp. PH5-45]|uniref:hypothetical protein n=1 Tax=unclassified Dysgonomonas TaxID=2630389 RepID=UPI0024731E98|nr:MULTISPECIES: hypothetical protein [unclassified Dysgonomonas]MDH6355888.1 hypothetical protein [Dysgonomonas sp. PH5-45]MDH6388804.1 hypothetical protein [Dysgonomonas sp. PH5-37]